MTSVERVVQYNHLDQEAPWVTDVVPPDTWPDQGHISLKDVSLRYPGQESLALRDVTLTVKAREKVRKPHCQSQLKCRKISLRKSEEK